MKRILTILLTAIPLLTFQPQTCYADKLEILAGQFNNPDKVFRTVPFFVWNNEVTTTEIDRMLTQLKEQGSGGVFIHPRMGLVTEYLSQEWFDCVRYTVRRCHELDLELWLYDENSYPSGFAGGHTAKQMPSSWNQGQGLVPLQVSLLPDDATDAFIVLRNANGGMADITASVGDYAGKKGEYFLYHKITYASSPWKAGGTYVDLLVEGVTEKFMDITMSGYEKYFGTDLGRTFKGIFTDEPEIAPPTRQSLRWTPDLFAVFEKEHGYDLRTHLPCLHTETGDWKRVRHDYLKTILGLFIDRWARPWYEYCEKKGLVWTGHYWEHMWPSPNYGPDNMAMAAWQQYPGIDMLFNQFDDQNFKQFGNIRAVKEVSSVANQLGRERVLSETYGGSGWSTTFRDFKRLADWEIAVGVNLVNQHFSPQSIIGIRKFDFPPFFSPVASWWEDYRTLNDYLGRLCAVMSMGDERNEILVLEPTTTTWLYGPLNATRIGGPHDMIRQAFDNLLRCLKNNMVEYDLGCEDMFTNNGSAKGNRFVVGRREYRTVIVPPLTENLESATLELLKKFAAEGGRVIALSSPGLVDGKTSGSAAEFFASTVVEKYSDISEAITSLNNDKVDFHSVTGGNVYHRRREFEDGQLLFLVNSSLESTATVDVALEGNCLTLMDAMDGKTYTIPHTSSGGKVRATVTIEPTQSAILQATPYCVAAAKPVPVSGGRKLDPVRQMEINRLKDNVMVMDYLDLQTGDSLFNNIYYAEATHKVFTPEGFAGDPWYRAIQFGREFVEKDLSASRGFTATYQFSVEKGVNLESIKLLVERPELFTVRINGRTIAAAPDNWLMDPQMRLIPVGSLVREGANTVTLYTPKTTIHSELGAMFVLGDFGVEDRDGEWTITPRNRIDTTGSWGSQGAPFYPWEVAYSKTYDIKETDENHYIKVDGLCGMLAQVWVNGKKAGIVFAEPWTLDISETLMKGINHIEVRVVGGMDNILGPHHAPHTGLNSHRDWENITTKNPASEYVLSEYGLYGDFDLYSNSQRGAYTMPYVRYDSGQAFFEKGAERISSPCYDIESPASEAIGQEYVNLPVKGAYLAWNVNAPANGLALRFTMPDSPTGDGTECSLDVLVNGRRIKRLNLTSYWAYQYIIKGVPWRDPAPGRYPVMRFDEMHTLLPMELNRGDELRLVKVSGDEIGVDFVELEQVPPPLSMPEGWLDITDFGAVSDDGKDDLGAVEAAVVMAYELGTGVYIPSGKFDLDGRLMLLFPGTRIQGAGIWYTELFFSNPQQGQGGIWANSEDLRISDFYMNTICSERMVDRKSVSYNGISGAWRGNSIVENIWLEHFRAGVWIAEYGGSRVSENLVVSGLRVRNVYADGIHFAHGSSNCIAQYCDVRNCGDDCLASWSSTSARQGICNQGNTFRWCTVELGWRASGVGLFGGGGHRIHNCYVGEMSGSSALRFVSDFPGCPFDPSDPIKVWDCTFYKCGSRSTFYGQIYGAIELHGKGFDILNMEMENIDIIDSQADGIRMTGQKVRDIVFRNVDIRGAGADGKSNPEPLMPVHRAYGVWCDTETDRPAYCSATLAGVKISDCPDGEIYNRGFKLNIEK